VGSLVLQKTAVELAKIQALARLRRDTFVVVVAGNGPIKTVNDLAKPLRSNPRHMTLGMRSVDGANPLLADLIARSASSKLKDTLYLSFSGRQGRRWCWRVWCFCGRADRWQVACRRLPSKHDAYGVKSVREQRLSVNMSRCGDFFTGDGVAAARLPTGWRWLKISMNYERSRKTLKPSYLNTYWLADPDLTGIIDLNVKAVQVMLHLLKLKALFNA
jgi:hypothetical protein